MTDNPIDRPTMTVDEPAKLLGIGRNQAYDAVRRGEVASIKIGHTIRVLTVPLRKQLGLEND